MVCCNDSAGVLQHVATQVLHVDSDTLLRVRHCALAVLDPVPLPHLHWDGGCPCHLLRRDLAHRGTICTGAGPVPHHICTGTGAGPRPHLHRDRAHPAHICTGTQVHPGGQDRRHARRRLHEPADIRGAGGRRRRQDAPPLVGVPRVCFGYHAPEGGGSALAPLCATTRARVGLSRTGRVGISQAYGAGQELTLQTALGRARRRLASLHRGPAGPRLRPRFAFQRSPRTAAIHCDPTEAGTFGIGQEGALGR